MATISITTTWNEQELQKTALEALQQLNWSVFPLALDKRPPPIGASSPGGIPKRLSWKPYQTRRASYNEVMIWHKRYQPSAYAVITGHISGIIILDFDGDVGSITLNALGLLPHVQTGSGGYHVYFRHPGWHVPTLNCKSKRMLGQQWPGLDIRADGGYGAFCGRNTHGPYMWLRDPIPEEVSLLPGTLCDFLGLLHAPRKEEAQVTCRIQEEETTQTISQRREHRDSKNIREKLIDRALSMISQAWGRNDAGFWLACQLRDNGYSREEGEHALLDYAHQVPEVSGKGKHDPYSEDEALASVASAYSKSARNGRRLFTDPHPSSNDNREEVGYRSYGAETPDGVSNPLAEIFVGSDQLREVTNQAVEALMSVEAHTPTLFLQAARLVRIGRNEMKRPIVTQMGVTEVKEVMTHSANY